MEANTFKTDAQILHHEKNHHVHLLVLAFVLLLFGLLMVHSSSALFSERVLGNTYNYTLRHIIHIFIGTGALCFAAFFDYRNFQRLAFFLMLVSFVLLVLVLFPPFGIKVYGARRWLNLIAFTFQPADFLKFAVMVWIADFTVRKREHMTKFWRSLVPVLLVIMSFAPLLILQPDFGSVVLIFLSLLMVTLIAGVRFFHLLFILVCGGVAGVGLIINSAYRYRRIKAFIDPWVDTNDTGYQLSNALIAYGGGGFFGRGLGNSLQKEFYLPQAHTDFITAIIAEEVGFVGFLILLGFYTMFIMKGFAVTSNCKDNFGRNLGFGLTIIIAFQALFHIFVTMGLLPTKGIGLPMISYGGSSMVMTMFMVGVLFNIGRPKAPLRRTGNDLNRSGWQIPLLSSIGKSKPRVTSYNKSKSQARSAKRKYFMKKFK